MNYRNGKDLLPMELLLELQKYVQGELIYIPRQNAERAGWGDINGTREQLKIRNAEIRKAYKSGVGVAALSEQYHLAIESIRKLVRSTVV